MITGNPKSVNNVIAPWCRIKTNGAIFSVKGSYKRYRVKGTVLGLGIDRVLHQVTGCGMTVTDCYQLWCVILATVHYPGTAGMECTPGWWVDWGRHVPRQHLPIRFPVWVGHRNSRHQ